MLQDIFLAPGRFLNHTFSKKRKKFRYVARSHEAGKILSLSVLAWLCIIFLACVAKAGFSTGPEPITASLVPPTILQPEEVPPPPLSQAPSVEPALPVPQLPNMAQSAALNQPLPSGTSTQTSPDLVVVPRELLPRPDSPPLEPPPEAWLVIIESIPKSARTKAEESQSRQRKKGLEVELVDTDAYPRLKSGMWALALGPFETKAQADLAAQRIKPKVKEFMVRRGL
ncbi:MAG: SPOR domain-containing protein [Deltaproteobacteria bacterium]|nr:SPOR domain-containing protein [Deltaproteobacteria bacterium]